jgi:hypothetical protein
VKHLIKTLLLYSSFFVVPCYDEVQGHWQKSRNLRNALMNENINIWNIRKRITLHRTHTNYWISIWCQFKLVCCAKYDRGLDLGFWEILKPLKWTNITSFFLIKTKSGKSLILTVRKVTFIHWILYVTQTRTRMTFVLILLMKKKIGETFSFSQRENVNNKTIRNIYCYENFCSHTILLLVGFIWHGYMK